MKAGSASERLWAVCLGVACSLPAAWGQETAPVSETDRAFDAALVAAQAGDEAGFERHAGTLASLTGAESPLSGELALERGLLDASQAVSGALDRIEAFVRRFPGHARQAEAQITLAELYLTQVPAQPVAAREHLEAARVMPLTLERREWLDHVAIWVEVTAQDAKAIVDRADRFLDDWPQSARRPAVLMVLGEAHFRAGKYAAAADQFARVALAAPDSDLAEPGLFFAARSASFVPTAESQQLARDLWMRVAESGGKLAAAARHEAGLLDLARGDFDQAVTAFEAVATSPNADAAMRVAARADRGEALFAKASTLGNDPALLESAAKAFAEVSTDPAAARSWRLQGAVRQGKCLEALGRGLEALEIYRGVVNEGAPTGPSAIVPVSEFDWFYRAGLAATRLLRETSQWREAVAIADRVAQAGGPRAAEATRMADSLRLRHFIWQDPSR